MTERRNIMLYLSNFKSPFDSFTLDNVGHPMDEFSSFNVLAWPVLVHIVDSWATGGHHRPAAAVAPLHPGPVKLGGRGAIYYPPPILTGIKTKPSRIKISWISTCPLRILDLPTALIHHFWAAQPTPNRPQVARLLCTHSRTTLYIAEGLSYCLNLLLASLDEFYIFIVKKVTFR